MVEKTSTPSLGSTPPFLQMQEVAFGYNQQALLYDVSVAVRAGEMVALLGPNGSGKTTLLRLLSGVLQPKQGNILLEGRDLRSWGRRQIAQRIAVVPQELHMPFSFTVEHMVGLGRTPFITSFWGSHTFQDQEIVHDAMQVAGVAPLAKSVFNELSGGERQRVTIAMALAQQPSILLLDEPTSHLDIKYQIETLALIQGLNRDRQMTVLAAMHDLNLAARYFSRLLLFQRGIVADGSPAEVLEPGLLSRVYDIQVQVGILRGAEHLSVLPPQQDDTRVKQDVRPAPLVHVIAGGGSGELIMRALADAQIHFSIGALNIGDSDHTLALRLAENVITEQPFAPISPDVLLQVHERLKQAKLLIICPTAIGPGNLALIREAVQAAQRGLPVILVAIPIYPEAIPHTGAVRSPDEDFLRALAMRDYTGGQGVLYVEELFKAGAIVTTSLSASLDEVKKRLTYQTIA
jgi:iron complex transport system ATP-binding protein